MTTQFRTKSSVAAIAVFALLLAATACGTTKGTALAPAAVAGAQQADSSATLAGDSYLIADGQYGVGSRTGGATGQTNDVHVCATSGSTCLEP